LPSPPSNSADPRIGPRAADHHLAADRTNLSNERTLLAYVRTGLSLFGVGATFIRFFDRAVFSAVGWVLLVAGIACLAAGVVRFQQIRGRVRRMRNLPGPREVGDED